MKALPLDVRQLDVSDDIKKKFHLVVLFVLTYRYETVLLITLVV
jgi:hypothetical protein